jgi:hypothetical protein
MPDSLNTTSPAMPHSQPGKRPVSQSFGDWHSALADMYQLEVPDDAMNRASERLKAAEWAMATTSASRKLEIEYKLEVLERLVRAEAIYDGRATTLLSSIRSDVAELE